MQDRFPRRGRDTYRPIFDCGDIVSTGGRAHLLGTALQSSSKAISTFQMNLRPRTLSDKMIDCYACLAATAMLHCG